MKKIKKKLEIVKKFDINEPVFSTAATIIIGWPWEKVKQYIEKHQHEDQPPIEDTHKFSDGVMFPVKTKRGDKAYLVYIKEFSFTNANIACLSHEVAHLIFRLLETHQIPIQVDNDEVFCKLQEYYINAIFKKLFS